MTGSPAVFQEKQGPGSTSGAALPDAGPSSHAQLNQYHLPSETSPPSHVSPEGVAGKKKDPRLVDRDDFALRPSEATPTFSGMDTHSLIVPLKGEPKAPPLTHGLDSGICSKTQKNKNKEEMMRCEFRDQGGKVAPAWPCPRS